MDCFASLAMTAGARWIASRSPSSGAHSRDLAMTEGSPYLPVLPRPHQIGKPLEQIMRVARDVGLGRAFRQGRLVHRETVVHRGDFHLAGGLVLDRMIGAVMALMHLGGFGADRQAQHLMA